VPDRTSRRPAPTDERVRALQAENRSLQDRLNDLTEEVSRNEALLRKTQERELELLRAGSLAQLLDRLIHGLRVSY
jgi:two-component system, cell cycle response regulator